MTGQQQQHLSKHRSSKRQGSCFELESSAPSCSPSTIVMDTVQLLLCPLLPCLDFATSLTHWHWMEGK